MFHYGTASKNKTMLPLHKGTKVPPELIEHFKNTPQIPPKRSFKQNQNPREIGNGNTHPDIKIEKKSTINSTNTNTNAQNYLRGPEEKIVKSQIIEGDFSKIANSYVLEGNVLKKQEVYEEVLRQENKKTGHKNKENESNSRTFDRKQILKLEYLQKMGFLRPEQKQALAQFRKFYPEQFTPATTHETTSKKSPTHPSRPIYPPESTNYLPYYSPKNMNIDPKMLNQFFSPNGKFITPSASHLPYY